MDGSEEGEEAGGDARPTIKTELKRRISAFFDSLYQGENIAKNVETRGGCGPSPQPLARSGLAICRESEIRLPGRLAIWNRQPSRNGAPYWASGLLAKGTNCAIWH